MKAISWDNYTLKEINTSRKHPTGSIHSTLFCGDIVILGQIDKFDIYGGNKYYNWFLIKFSDGFTKIANRSSLSIGRVENPYTPKVQGFGFTGEGRFSPSVNKKPTRRYIMWCGMLVRCLNYSDKIKHPTYMEATVDEKWHNFNTFCEDLETLEGYDSWLNDKNFQLDKDTIIEGNKHYSKATCRLISRKENNNRNVVKMFNEKRVN